FPQAFTVSKSAAQLSEAQLWRNTEEFIEDRFPVDIRFNLKIDCLVSQKAHRTFTLREFLSRGLRLAPYKSLEFFIDQLDPDLTEPYEIRWKVLSRGERARKLDCIRGQIKAGSKAIYEHTKFRGG